MQLQKIIEDLGFETVLEKQFGRYIIDIYLESDNKGIEYDGVGHYKRRDAKRDKYLKDNFGIDILRIADLDDPKLEDKIVRFCET